MYGVLYAYTPEVFPAPNRGTGTGIASCLNRIAGFCAPIVAVNAGEANPKDDRASHRSPGRSVKGELIHGKSVRSALI